MLHFKASALLLKVQTTNPKSLCCGRFPGPFGFRRSEEWGQGAGQKGGRNSKSQALVSHRNSLGIQGWKLGSGHHPPTLSGDPNRDRGVDGAPPPAPCNLWARDHAALHSWGPGIQSCIGLSAQQGACSSFCLPLCLLGISVCQINKSFKKRKEKALTGS